MSQTAEPIVRLAQALSKLPGIGPKSAQRIAYHVLRSSDAEVQELAGAILELKEGLAVCSVCFNIADSDPCSICRDARRDTSAICVVERSSDIPSIERTGHFHGRYHVLNGVLSPARGIGPDDINVRELLLRLGDGAVREVILATNPTVEGEATAMYVRQLVAPTGVQVTRLARGLPYGSDLEYADDITLAQAIDARQGF
jgi:recombination protein RecR